MPAFAGISPDSATELAPVSGGILVLNAGSSGMKFAVFAAGGAKAERLVRGEVECLGERPRLQARDPQGRVLMEREFTLTPPEEIRASAVQILMDWLDTHADIGDIRAVGHRVVHGGPDFARPVLIDDATLMRLEDLTPLAPMHQPACLAPVHALRRARPALPQVACFDTAFHRTMPAVAQMLPLPHRYGAKGIRRYGFHGLSYEHIARSLNQPDRDWPGARIVAAHIGNGASLCALHHGVSMDTTMGFSVLDGLVMGTRSGTIDPGVLLYMLNEERLTPTEVEDILYHRAGLLGVSGRSGDMRVLRAHMHDPAVRMALDLAVYRFAQQVGAMVAVLDGVDGIVFTGGIGEHDAAFRRDVCTRLAWLGVALDGAANETHRPLVSTPDSAVQVHVIAADEEASIHRHVLACIAQ
nr:acetate/propionate family kinase [Acetobacter garciniae]